jgi:DNA-binding MarR family transcriptional regulator
MRKMIFLLMLSLVSFQVFGRNATVLSKKQFLILKSINRKLSKVRSEFSEVISLSNNKNISAQEYSTEIERIVKNKKRTAWGFVASFFTGIDAKNDPFLYYRNRLAGSFNSLISSIEDVTDRRAKLLNNTDEGILLVQQIKNHLGILEVVDQCILNSALYQEEFRFRSTSSEKFKTFFNCITNVFLVCVVVITAVILSTMGPDPHKIRAAFAFIGFSIGIACVIGVKITTYLIALLTKYFIEVDNFNRTGLVKI